MKKISILIMLLLLNCTHISCSNKDNSTLDDVPKESVVKEEDIHESVNETTEAVQPSEENTKYSEGGVEHIFDGDDSQHCHAPDDDDGDCTSAIICKTCGTVFTAGRSEHIPKIDDGDCTSPVYCNYCDYAVIEAQKHSYSDTWKYNNSEHWRICSNNGCSYIEAAAEHIKNNDGVCEVCGYIIDIPSSHSHVFNVIEADKSSHWNKCLCGEIDENSVNSHSDEADDNDCVTPLQCKDCGYVIVEGKEHSLGVDDNNCLTDVNCSVCGKVVKAGMTEHIDNNNDFLCDNDNCRLNLEGVPLDENEGIDLPIDWN